MNEIYIYKTGPPIYNAFKVIIFLYLRYFKYSKNKTNRFNKMCKLKMYKKNNHITNLYIESEGTLYTCEICDTCNTKTLVKLILRTIQKI